MNAADRIITQITAIGAKNFILTAKPREKSIEENKASDKAQWAAVIINVRTVSGFGGRILVHSTRKDRNLAPVAIRKIMIKLKLKLSTSLAKFLTLLD
uniref:Uncharacterized protein n=1 Tax=uncultured bacterium contig00002 TaxID=1181494 RepID=A0A806KK45_9BACT|nr:hypothetical protein [uncultured bacterium contig00002]